MYIFTDGITEIKNPEGNELGSKGFQNYSDVPHHEIFNQFIFGDGYFFSIDTIGGEVEMFEWNGTEFEKINELNEKIFVVAGGVAANKKIRSMLINLCEENNYKSIFPPIEFCGDNAAMIAMVGLEKFKINQFDDLDYPAKPRWPLDEDAAFLKGAGVQL